MGFFFFYSIKVTVCFSYTLSSGNKAFRKAISKCTPASGVFALCFIQLTVCLFLFASAVKYTVDADQNRRGARVRFLNKQSTFTSLLSFSTPACQELNLTVNVRNHLITPWYTQAHRFPCFMGSFHRRRGVKRTWKPYLSKSTDTLKWKLQVTNSKTTWEYLRVSDFNIT